MIFVVILFVVLAFITGYIRWKWDKTKDFQDVIRPLLKIHGLNFTRSEYPGLFQVGPFKKVTIEIGKPQINNGAIQYERTHYRKVFVTKENGEQIEIWAKIETGWFKKPSVIFDPLLEEV